MPFAFNLTLDDACQQRIEHLYAQLARLDVPDRDLVTHYGPCVTLLVLADSLSAETVSALLAWKLPTLSALAATFTGPCVIDGTPPTLALRVAASDALLALHHALYNELPEADVHLRYRPAHWQPHLKLSNVRDEPAGARLAAALTPPCTPFTGTLGGLEVMHYPPVQSIWQATLRLPA